MYFSSRFDCHEKEHKDLNQKCLNPSDPIFGSPIQTRIDMLLKDNTH